MQNFTFHNPTKIVFGRGSLAKLARLVPPDAKVMVTWGGGSIKRNGVWEQVMEALGDRAVLDFGGIEPNPQFATLVSAARKARDEGVDFLLAVGGGSVVDGTKFIAAAARFPGEDPWEIVTSGGRAVKDALPFGAVLTLPATGSEANPNAVVSRKETGEKRAFGSPSVYPVFSVLDPETTYTLPRRQVANGIVDAFVHVMEQYATRRTGATLQDRQAEAILHTLVEEAPAILADPPDYEARATFMWAATNALDLRIGLGVPQDWATHMIGHELTAAYGLDHGLTLAIVLPRLLAHQVEQKREKLAQYGARLFGVDGAEAAIARTEAFFREVGLKTRLSEHGVDAEEAAARVREALSARGAKLGEHGDLDPEAAAAIVRACA